MAESLVSDQEEEALLATVPGQGAATVYRTETALPGSYASVADVLRVNMPEDAKEDFAIETIEQGEPRTDYMKFGDTIRIEMKGRDGLSLFGAIDQRVVGPRALDPQDDGATAAEP